MARLTVAPSRALLKSLRPGYIKFICQCTTITRITQHEPQHSRRSMSIRPSEMEVDGKPSPRWARTPPAMKAPVSVKYRQHEPKPFKVNSDPAVLDEVYRSLLGKNGDQLLSEETKWLAVTHKSFDQGRRGFNERLAYLGKRVIELQISLGMLNSTNPLAAPDQILDPHGREPFQHPAIDNIEILSGKRRNRLSQNDKYARLAKKHDLHKVIRWLPKNPDNLEASGSGMVYAQSVCAIVGAVALERGGAIANEIVRERILKPIGVTADLDEQVESSAESI